MRIGGAECTFTTAIWGRVSCMRAARTNDEL